MRKTNQVVRVSFSGGLLGIIFGSARGKLEDAIAKQNKEGWNLAEVVPDNPNLLIWVLRLAILILTLGLWTLSTGYLLIMEKPVGGGVVPNGSLGDLPTKSGSGLRATRRG